MQESDRQMTETEIVLGATAAVDHVMFLITGELEYLLEADQYDKLFNELLEENSAK